VEYYLLYNYENLEDIHVVYSHPEAFKECKDWLAENLPKVKKKEAKSTSEAARLASQEPNAAAISSKECAKKYGYGKSMEAEKDKTRFLVLGKPLDEVESDKQKILVLVKKTESGEGEFPPALKKLLDEYEIEKKLISSSFFFFELEGQENKEKEILENYSPK
ncbi:3351_t:CDS:2, partial [Racocetra persica]